VARRWLNSMDVEVGTNGAPLFDVAGCASFIGGAKTVPSAGTPQALVASSTPCRFVWIGARVDTYGNPMNTRPCFVGDAASQNIVLMQTAGGYGVLTSDSGEVTYMKVGGAGVGFGVGLKAYREVIIFRDRDDFERFREHGWDAGGQAEASLKAGDRGGSAAGAQSLDFDIITYQMVESGAALQATVGASRYWRWKELN